ncbi:unannotated protein [freshwater metagenome]|uniref:Unannotated protein n=1 Tax=freshwater metagenome TaxID=449393 RepID=A0A6J7R6D7_9ZZZZ
MIQDRPRGHASVLGDLIQAHRRAVFGHRPLRRLEEVGALCAFLAGLPPGDFGHGSLTLASQNCH